MTRKMGCMYAHPGPFAAGGSDLKPGFALGWFTWIPCDPDRRGLVAYPPLHHISKYSPAVSQKSVSALASAPPTNMGRGKGGNSKKVHSHQPNPLHSPQCCQLPSRGRRCGLYWRFLGRPDRPRRALEFNFCVPGRLGAAAVPPASLSARAHDERGQRAMRPR